MVHYIEKNNGIGSLVSRVKEIEVGDSVQVFGFKNRDELSEYYYLAKSALSEDREREYKSKKHSLIELSYMVSRRR